jgi:hypothetical protein
MAIRKDLATLEGHREPFNHLAESVVWDATNNISVKDIILTLLASFDSGENGVVAFDVTCGLGVAEGSFVYMDPFGVAQLGLADDINTARLIGVVVISTDSLGTHCNIKQIGPVDAYLGLIPGQRYFLSDTIPGGLTATPPTSPGYVVHSVGIAISATTLYVNTNIQPTIRS